MKKILVLMILTGFFSINVLPSSEAINENNSTTYNQVSVCTVADPTGTPLNVRSKPRTGKVVSKLKNGTVVEITSEEANPEGDGTNTWVTISLTKKGKRKTLGWVAYKYLNCN